LAKQLAKPLVIVESPAKAKTIGKFLSNRYTIKASVGHVIDLPKSKMGVDIENDFDPQYITIRGKGDILKDIKKAAKKASKIYLATDPDREGEAIAWHLSRALKLEPDAKVRVEFHEITKDAVKTAIKKPRSINTDLVDSQQARRVLDRLVGYKISPLLWGKVRKGLSAGRVQSAVTKIICDREREIKAFNPEEYWEIMAIAGKDKIYSQFNLIGKVNGSKIDKIKMGNEEEALNIQKVLETSEMIVKKISSSDKKKNPNPPFTTSTLQQEASKNLNFATNKTMRTAQELYEGIEIQGNGTVGLITYLRTDSVRISDTALEASKDWILSEYGDSYYEGKKEYKKKGKRDIQDAHEAIRPTNVDLSPDKIKSSLSRDQYKLYKLIWNRFVASQMKPANYKTHAIDVESGEYKLRTSDRILIFDGFLKLYPEKIKSEKKSMPKVEKEDVLDVKDIEKSQHFTQAPPRYNEASLVKMLEELGIGRPSTYAPTISTIISRGYVEKEQKTLIPTELGFLVNDLLEEYFKTIVNKEFTATMEDQLDAVEAGEIEWKEILRGFYGDFEKAFVYAEEKLEKFKIEDEISDILCENCGKNMVVKHGRYGKFLACPGYPECKNTKPILKTIDVPCPKCGGKIVEKKSKKGKKFYGCEKYPECDFVAWSEPVEKKCPECGEYMVKKRLKSKEMIKCSACGYQEEVE
jgi:DNA topoisomerase-1